MLTQSKQQEVKRLLQKKHRDKEKKFIVEGWKSIEEAIRSNWIISDIIVESSHEKEIEEIPSMKKYRRSMYVASSRQFSSISDTVTPQGILAVVEQNDQGDSLDRLCQQDSITLLLLEGINDPGNLGTIIRTCDWFGIDAVILDPNCAELYNPKVVRATMGSLFHLPVFTDQDLVSFVKSYQTEIRVYAAMLNSAIEYRTVQYPKKTALVIGSESHGISSELSTLAHTSISIPLIGNAESLNAAIACGIILSHMKAS